MKRKFLIEKSFDDPMYQTYLLRRGQQMRTLQHQVGSILRTDYALSPTDINALIKTHFDRDYLPNWYFHSTTPQEIARHIFLITQKLDANTEYLTQISDDGKMITYIVNVGRDVPGKLLQIIRANQNMGILAFDSVKTRTGIWIKTIERHGRTEFPMEESEALEAQVLKQMVRDHLRDDTVGADFLGGLPVNYLHKELNRFTYPRRILRHADLFKAVLDSPSRIFVSRANTDNEIDALNEKVHNSEERLCVVVKNPDAAFLGNVLDVFETLGINLSHSCYDAFASRAQDCTVGIVSLHVSARYDLENAIRRIEALEIKDIPIVEKAHHALELDLERIVKIISSSGSARDDKRQALGDLRGYIARNTDTATGDETGDFLLNSLSDFYAAAEFLGIHDNPDIICLLLKFDAFDEFWVETRFKGKTSVTEGYRTKHNSARGANKGGLRIDMVVKFVEVAALAFMMTWKCARSKILFGGGKGGLKLNPKEYNGDRIDYFDTLTNFGRLLFLVTGSLHDVPAGDVGCGGLEIGHLFEGFKSALRDLAMTVFGIKKGVSIIGNTVVSIEGARAILQSNFGIDCDNQQLLERLATDEDYLELVVAAQITGKPKLGLAARSGATGSGLRFCLFAAVIQEYIAGRWETPVPLSDDEIEMVKKVSRLSEKELINSPDRDIIPDREWQILDTLVFPKLLKDKKVIVQGSGDVGGSIIEQLCLYGTKIVAVADAGGAVTGASLDARELLAAVKASRSHPEKAKRSSVVNTTQTGVQITCGAQEGAFILELPCDILIPAALENAITVKNAYNVKARIILCGSNGANSSKAEKILVDRGIVVLYDFLANGGGVGMSYAEWLTSLAARKRYEACEIFNQPFDPDGMDAYIMPEFRGRIKRILSEEQESAWTTAEWNKVLRDIMFVAVNEDYAESRGNGISMKTAGFANAIKRVLTAILLNMTDRDRKRYWQCLSQKAKAEILPFFFHPEAALHNENIEGVLTQLGATATVHRPGNSG